MMEKIEKVMAGEGQEGIGLSPARIEAHREYEIAKGFVVIRVEKVEVQSQEVEKPQLGMEPLMEGRFSLTPSNF